MECLRVTQRTAYVARRTLKGRLRVTCKRGHDRTLPGAIGKGGQCKQCAPLWYKPRVGRVYTIDFALHEARHPGIPRKAGANGTCIPCKVTPEAKAIGLARYHIRAEPTYKELGVCRRRLHDVTLPGALLADGRCQQCTVERANKRYHERMSSDPVFVVENRRRGRETARRLAFQEKMKRPLLPSFHMPHTDQRSRLEKIRAMAQQVASPQEAGIAQRKLKEVSLVA